MRRFIIVVLLFIVIAPYFAEAQSFYAIRRNRNLLVGAGTGTANYYGEMVNPGELGILKPNITFSAEYYWTDRISTRAQVTWFQFSGDDSEANDDRRRRNLMFRSSNIEFSAIGVINLTPLGLRFYQRPTWNIHAFAGVGVLYFNPKAKIDGEWVALAPLETEGKKYSRVIPVFPVGLGVRYKVDPFFNVILEGGYRVTFTDHLDDVSVVRYPDPATLKSDLARRLSDRRAELGPDNVPANPLTQGRRGNPEKNDGYFIANVTVQYYLPQEIFRNSQRKLYKSRRKAYYRRR